MQTFAALSMLATTIITAVVGGRLLLVARRTHGVPELLFGIGFIGMGLGEGFAQAGQRLIWTTPGPLATALNTGLYFLVVISIACLYAAIWRVFRIDTRRGWITFLLGTAAAVIAYGMRIRNGDFSSGAADSAGAFLFTTTRISLFCWASMEAFRHYGMLCRRVRLGLADPVVANQIFLWGVAAVFSMGVSVVIGHNTIMLHRSPLEDPLSTSLLMVFVIVTSVSMWCSFFPPAALRRRLEVADQA